MRYAEFQNGLENYTSQCDYSGAIERITIGFCKKVLVADKIAALANFYYDGAAAGHNYSVVGFWLGSLAYTLQIYFDFSGYSDMAVGIGQLLGFTVRENFNKPYQAGSISDFWKRWHISVTQWFRDYIYIPLGGNRCKVPRHICNMLTVWLLTGIWHGADWSFVIWGLGNFILLVIEKYVPQMKRIESTPIGHIYTLFFVNLLWVPFRAESIGTTVRFLCGMFGAGTGSIEEEAMRFFPFVVFAVALCFPWDRWLAGFWQKRWFAVLKGITMLVLAFLAICGIVNASYAPYIYGNF